MTIKHLGGVFGRNPTFNDVTIEGQLTFEGNIDVDSDITWDDNKKALFGDNADLAIYSDGTQSFITESGPGRLYIGGTHLSITNSAGTKKYFEGIDGGAATLYNSGSAKLSTSSTGISVTGNIAVNSGNGIDFSATSGTGTSELFDDYEEGTWTPSITAATVGDLSVTYTRQVGVYTKVGRLVTASFRITTSAFSHSTAANEIYVAGLPFTSRNVTDMKTIGAGYVYGANKTGFTQLNGSLDPATDRLEFVATGPAGSSISSLKITEVASGGTPFLGGTITYEV